ncbi:Cellobiose 2-epimerase [Caprobacter fermentans]|uniref:Cellobiose 2-epimerase n=2 Tax=Caproicibacter fermentans TaxID=2576756 RepID=A0A6N8I301_9FIRM|nr:Cellobiose 2-epimerase [Caproicibacter fermentans]
MLQGEVRQMLTETIIPFWKKLRDDENGGYYGWVDYDLGVSKKAVKGCILNSRILWFFSTGSMLLKRSDLREEADHAYAFLKSACLDREHGGVYWSVNYDGAVADSTKHTYNQAFAIYALSAYHRLTGDPEPLELARGIYRLIEEKCTDEVGYLEAFDREFRPVLNEKLSEHGLNAEKTMNTLLHVFEGYSGLYEASHDEAVGNDMRRILHIFAEKVYNPEKKRQEVFFDRNMNSLIDLHSYGHDIEASWLMDWGCGLLKDPELTGKISTINSELAESIYRTAYHKHSLWSEAVDGVPDKTRVWWVQAETVLGFLNEYQKHPEHPEYFKAVTEAWDYIKTKMADPRPGSEWFWQLDDDGNPDPNKPFVEPWKCPYHNGRMCFEIIRRSINAEC